MESSAPGLDQETRVQAGNLQYQACPERCQTASPLRRRREVNMKTVLIVIGVLIVLATLFADYKWRQWMAARRRARGLPEDPNRR